MEEPARHRIRPGAYFLFGAAFALVVFLSHAPFVNLPFFWDELGQFIPAALDIFRHGQWVPHSAVPNVHPPGVMAYLAAVWSVAGYSIAATRLAMLLVASASVLVAFLAAIRLLGPVRGSPAFVPVALLLVSPLFYMQAFTAQLDMPAMLFTLWALLLFLEDHWIAAALVSIPLVLVKETGVVTPLVFGVWLLKEKRPRQATWFLLPLAALGAWLIVLLRCTGHLFGSAEFTDYNLFYPLHPVRLAVALLRRIYFLGIADFHWIGAIAIVAGWRAGVYATRAWRIAGVVALANVLVVTVLGGASLERYLLPVLPLVYIAMAAGWSVYGPLWRRASQVALAAGLLVSFFWNPPYPFPYENNLAMVDFVRVQQQAAVFLEQNFAAATVTTVWPLSAALRQPEFGYVEHKLKVRELKNLEPSTAAALDPGDVEVFVLYSASWNPPGNLLRAPSLRRFWMRFYGYQPDISSQEVERWLGTAPVARWERHGQWAEVYVR